MTSPMVLHAGVIGAPNELTVFHRGNAWIFLRGISTWIRTILDFKSGLS